MELILASGSPRRALLLGAAGVSFTTVVPDVDETPIEGEPPAEYVLRLSETKARSIERSDDQVVLAADTTVVFNGSIIGKPGTLSEAVEILTELVGETHSILTGWTVTDGETEEFGVDESLVRFNERTNEELVAYVERTQPLDKAGGYALQGDDGWLVSEVIGSRSNVMGLPIREVIDALRTFGIERSTP
ncbi:MAG: Maf family protein [Actinomycetia bacterium]|nr:Maf family protein [Actinomycetes bacterium]